MQGARWEHIVPSEGAVDAQAALWLLGSLAGFHRQPFDADLVLQRFAPPFDLPTLIEALEALGLKAGLAPWPAGDGAQLPLPAVVFLAAPGAAGAPQEAGPLPLIPALLVEHAEHPVAWVRPGQTQPEPFSLPNSHKRSACP